MYIKIENEEIIGRIKQIIKELKEQSRVKSQAKIARDMGMSPQQLTEVLSGRNKLTPQIILKFCIATNVNYEYVTQGKIPVYDVDEKNKLLAQIILGTEYKETEKTISESANTQVIDMGSNNTQISVRGIPFYDMDVTAGITESFADVREEVQYYINYPPLNDCDAAFPVYGDSMEPDFYAGDVVLVREIRNVDSMLWGEPYLIITDAACDNLRTIKNVYLSEDRRSFILRASNPKYSGDTIVPRDNVLKIFLVKGKVARRQL